MIVDFVVQLVGLIESAPVMLLDEKDHVVYGWGGGLGLAPPA